MSSGFMAAPPVAVAGADRKIDVLFFSSNTAGGRSMQAITACASPGVTRGRGTSGRRA